MFPYSGTVPNTPKQTDHNLTSGKLKDSRTHLETSASLTLFISAHCPRTQKTSSPLHTFTEAQVTTLPLQAQKKPLLLKCQGHLSRSFLLNMPSPHLSEKELTSAKAKGNLTHVGASGSTRLFFSKY